MGIDQLSAIWSEWNIVERIGEGSFGDVYKVMRNEHGFIDYAAVKVISIPRSISELNSLKADGYDESSARSYFEGVVTDCVSEIKLMVSMKGTANIVNVEDYKVVEKTGVIGWDIFIRMELLTSFVDHSADKKLTESEVIKLGQDMCSALELCAAKNIIHRDIKPENIFRSSFGDYKLGDFGIARELEKSSGAMSMTSIGTFNYVAPEIPTTKKYDATVDIYSLGLVLYRQLNNNRLPFIDPYADQITYQARKDAAERRINGEALPFPVDASPEMGHVILRACSFDPSLRFRTATEFKQALEDVKNGKYVIRPYEKSKPEKPVQDTGETGGSGNLSEQGKLNKKRSKINKNAVIIAGITCFCLIAVVFILYRSLGSPDGGSSPPSASGTPPAEQATPPGTSDPAPPAAPTPVPKPEKPQNEHTYRLDTTGLVDVFPLLSTEERNALHVFFSNFAEAYFVEFDIDDHDINLLINFAIRHNYINFFQRFYFNSQEGRHYISDRHVAQIIERFFDIRYIDHDDYVDPYGFNYYYDGNYYVEFANGEPPYFAQVTGLYEQNDGTFIAQFDVYYFLDVMVPGDLFTNDFTFRVFYQDKENWPGQFREYIYYQYSAKSLIVPFNFNGRETYRLLLLEMDINR